MGMKSPFPLSAFILCRGVSSTRRDGKELRTPLDNPADTRIHISECQSPFPAKDPFFLWIGGMWNRENPGVSLPRCDGGPGSSQLQTELLELQ